MISYHNIFNVVYGNHRARTRGIVNVEIQQKCANNCEDDDDDDDDDDSDNADEVDENYDDVDNDNDKTNHQTMRLPQMFVTS